MINKHIDINKYKTHFELDRRTRVGHFFEDNIAENLHDTLKTKTPYNLNYVIDNEFKSESESDMKKKNQAELSSMTQTVLDQASKGIGFIYQGYANNPQNKALSLTNESLKPLHAAFDFLNTDACLNVIKEITGDKEIYSAECQFTRFLPGHFLTRHQDEVDSRNRKYAFVISLTKDWHTDWGGLLQFYFEDGTPKEPYNQVFNAMSLFDIKHIHSVTYIAPFAKRPRLSLTGWFLGK